MHISRLVLAGGVWTALTVGFFAGALLRPDAKPPAPKTIEATAPRNAPAVDVVQAKPLPAPKLIPGWHVQVFPNRQLAELFDPAKYGAHAGAFRHAADWLTMNEHQRYTGVFADDNAAFLMEGFFNPEKTGKHVFAAHLRVLRRGGDSQRERRLDPISVRCSAKIVLWDSAVVVAGKLQVDADDDKASLQGLEAASLMQGSLVPVTALIACDLPEGVRASDVMLRICVRGAEEPKFRPVPALTPWI